MTVNSLPLKRLLGPLWLAHGYAQLPATVKRTRELRWLQRRLAAARLGVGWPRQRVRPSLYEDLR